MFFGESPLKSYTRLNFCGYGLPFAIHSSALTSAFYTATTDILRHFLCHILSANHLALAHTIYFSLLFLKKSISNNACTVIA